MLKNVLANVNDDDMVLRNKKEKNELSVDKKKCLILLVKIRLNVDVKNRSEHSLHRGVTRVHNPYLGLMVMRMSGTIFCPDSRVKLHRCTSKTRITFASIMAKFCPIQFRGPAEKGR